jgi:meso-butanediol dehydrogenase/(S,S)-butanediol dehydrogenase/diacetyl reductase
MYNLSGKVALVTGVAGKRGFGRAIAVRLAKDGADVVVVDKFKIPPRDEDLAENWKGIDGVVHEIKGLGRQALALTCDISRSDEVDRMVNETLEKFGRIDILVNNASVHIKGSIESITDEVWYQNISTNLTGTFFCSRAVSREMMKRKIRGRIINIASLSGKRAVAKDVAYCASKFGVIGVTQSIALELAPYGILVNAICPALANTDIGSEMFKREAQREGIRPEDARQREFNKRIPSIPLGRLTAVEDVANTVAFLASEEAEFITGQSINVCGGSLTAH